MTRYTATATRRERYWFVQCDQYPGATSTVTRLDQAAEHQREAIAFVADIPEDEIEVDVHPMLTSELSDELQRARQLAQQASDTEEQARAMRRDVARKLTEDGLTVRDVGTVLGVSYQRAHQLVKS